MQVLLDRSGMATEVSTNAGQIRRWILAVFPDAVVIDRLIDQQEIEIDDCFALCRNPVEIGEADWWTLCSKRRQRNSNREPWGIELGVLGDFHSAEAAVGRLVVVLATLRLEKALGKAVSL